MLRHAGVELFDAATLQHASKTKRKIEQNLKIQKTRQTIRNILHDTRNVKNITRMAEIDTLRIYDCLNAKLWYKRREMTEIF